MMLREKNVKITFINYRTIVHQYSSCIGAVASVQLHQSSKSVASAQTARNSKQIILRLILRLTGSH